jgi:lysophospholipase
MWGLAHPWAVQRLARALSRAAVRAGLGGAYAAGGGDAPYAGQGFAGNRLTACPDRYAAIARLTAAHPALALGGATWGWVRAAFAEMDALWTLRCPVPALVAVGGAEAIVSPDAIRRRAVRDGMALLDLPGARHEPFFETAPTRARLWAGVDAFLAARGL